MSLPKLLDPAALYGRSPKAVRLLALGHFGKVAMALAADRHLTLAEPEHLRPESVAEWRDAIAEEILLLAQDEPARASALGGAFSESRPFRHGPALWELLALDGAVAVVPVDTSDPDDPHRQGAWMHLWVIRDPEDRLRDPDDRRQLESVDPVDAEPESGPDGPRRLYLATGPNSPARFSGCSWQLAWVLATRALGSDYKRQLALYWIVSGEIENADIRSVRLGNKLNSPWFQTGRSWLLPEGNVAEAVAAAGARSDFRTNTDRRIFGARTVREALERVRNQRIVWLTQTDGPPFVGLDPYEARHRRVFFGRRESIERCRRFLMDAAKGGCAFLLIVGESGSGKSSLARAGLAPEIAEPGDPLWLTAVFRPSGEPLAALVETISAAVCHRTPLLAGWEDDLAENPERFARHLAQALGPDVRLLLVVDQLEDALHAPALTAASKSPEQDTACAVTFAESLLALSRCGSAWVVATLRADQVAALSKSEPFWKLIKQGATYYVLPPDFAEIIRRPVEAAGLLYEHVPGGTGDLGDVLLDEVRKAGPDALPLLQMTLDQLFTERDKKRLMLTFAAYDKIGRLPGAIARHAENVLRELDKDSRQELRPLLLGLAGQNADGSLLLRRVAQSDWESPPARRRLVKSLLNARLLAVDGKDKLRLTHEALLREWKAAAEILHNYHAVIELRDGLQHYVPQWLARRRDSPGDLKGFLLQGARLRQAEMLLGPLREMLPETSNIVAYIEASLDEEARDLRTSAVLLAKARENLARYLATLEFDRAETEFDNVARYSGQNSDDLPPARERIQRLNQFYTAARRAETLAGEEDFAGALGNCRQALEALRGTESMIGAYLAIEAFGAPADPASVQIKQLEQTAYHARLLYCTLQLAPGIEILFPPSAPGPSRPARFRKVKDLLRLVPQPALRLFLKAGGAKLLPLPGRQGNPKALEEFKKCREELTRVQQLEQDTAARNAEPYQPSRASCLLEQLIAVLSELAGGNKGDPIDYTAWLSLEAPDAPPEPVNAVDYFFIGLFNYFIAKRRDALLPKMLSLVHGAFPDLHARALLPNAERLLRSAVDLDRENFWAHWLLGRTLLEAKNYGAAELAFNAAIALQPRYARAWEQLALALGHQWTLTHDPRIYARAEAASRMALQLAAGDPSIFWPRGELYQLLRCESEAVAAFSNWLALEENIPALISRSSGVGTLFELACRLLEDTPSGPKRAHSYALLALVYLTWAGWGETESPNQNQSEAVKAAEAALNLCPTHAHALTVLGVVRCQQTTTHPAKALKAVECLRRALDIDPLAYRAAFHLPRALALAGKNDERAAAWTDLLARAENAARQMGASAAPSLGQQVRELCPAWMIAHARRALAMEKPDFAHPR